MSLIIKSTGFEDYLDRSGGAFVKCLIMGQPDVGKTRSASFWPRPIFADCEKGRMSIADRGVAYAEVNSSADMDALLKTVKLDCNKPPESRKYQTFVLDTIDSYQRKVIAERLAKEKKEALSGWADWGYLDAKMTDLIEKLLNLPMNIVVNLHTKDETEGDDESRLLVKKPKLKGDIREQIAAEFDLVGLMETGYIAQEGQRIKQRWVRWHSEPKFPALKDRSGRLPQTTPITFTEDDYTNVFNHSVGDHVEQMPESTVLDELDVETDVPPADPDQQGGPVDPGRLRDNPKKTTKKTTAKKTTKKAAAKKPADQVSVEGGATPAPPPERANEPSTSVAASEADEPAAKPAEDDPQPANTDADDAAALVASELGGTEIEQESPDADAEDTTKAHTAEEELLCGSQPAHWASKAEAAPGCGKPLTDVARDRVNIAILRTKTRLCPDCFEQWKQAN